MNEVTELAAHLVSWQALGGFFGVVVVFGFFPGFILRWIVKLYPPRHARRRQLLADMYELPLRKRWFFVAEQFETVLFEGLPDRLRSSRHREGPPSQRRRALMELMLWLAWWPSVIFLGRVSMCGLRTCLTDRSRHTLDLMS